MSEKQILERIHVDPEIMVGKPVIKGTRLTVAFIVGLLAHGASFEEILEEYPGLSTEDVRACLLFASEMLDSTEFMPIRSEVS